MATKVDDDVIGNINAGADVDEDGTHAIELEDIQPTTKPEVNGQHNSNNNNNQNGNNTNKGKGGMNNPLQYPKIFIALLVVLIIAVIALSFVLHSVDNRVDESNGAKGTAIQNKKELRSLESEVRKLTAKNKELEQKLKNATSSEWSDHTIIVNLSKTQKTLGKEQARVNKTLGVHSKSFQDLNTKIENQNRNVQQIEGDVKSQKEYVEKLASNLTKTSITLNKATSKLTKLESGVSTNRQDILSVNTAVKKNKENITNMEKKTSKLTTSVEGNSKEISKHKEDIKNMNTSLISDEKETVKLGKKLDETNANLDASTRNITLLNGLTEDLGKSVKNNTKEVNIVDRFFHQLNMKTQYNKTLADKIGLTFKEILELTGEEDKVEKVEPVITKLLKQQEEFQAHQQSWNITIKDITRLTDGKELKGHGELTTIKKLVKLNKDFTVYNTKWNITFHDLIRLTTKEDMEEIPIEDGSNSIAILEKIDQLFNAFSEYKDLWKIHFKDIVDITENLAFTDATKSPALVKVKSWYVPGFPDVWGESFDGFFHIMKEHPSKQSDFLKKIKKIAEKERKKRFLKMLPGRFIYDGTTLSVNGYIQVFYEGRYSGGMVRGNGTVWSHGQGEHYRFTDATATTLCAIGGYSYTRDGWSDGKYCDGTSDDRSKLNCFLSGIQCMGTGSETDLSQCNKDPDPTTPPPTTTHPTPTTRVSTRVTTKATTKIPTTSSQTTTANKTNPTHQPTVFGAVLLSSWNHAEDVAIKCNL